ncbi:MAG: GNAT family N-acetyltransferase [Anaerolineae bacterium]
MFIAQTDRLILRQLQADDLDALKAVFGDVEVMRFGPGVQTVEWMREWLQNCLEHTYPTHGFGPYAVTLKYNGEMIGYCGLFHFPDVGGQPEIEIGYRLARRSWGAGYATEASCAVRDYAFTVIGLCRLIAMIDPGNTASIRVAEKLGMHYEKDVMFEGYTHPDRVYAIACVRP